SGGFATQRSRRRLRTRSGDARERERGADLSVDEAALRVGLQEGPVHAPWHEIVFVHVAVRELELQDGPFCVVADPGQARGRDFLAFHGPLSRVFYRAGLGNLLTPCGRAGPSSIARFPGPA